MEEEISEEDLKRISSKYFKIGLSLLSSMFLIFIIAILFPNLDVLHIIITFLVLMTMTIIGIIILFAYSYTAKNLLYNVKILKNITNDIKILKKYAIGKYKDIYIVADYNMLYCFAFIEGPIETAEKIHFPKTFWKWNKKVPFPNLDVYVREGYFVIPSEENRLGGNAILYAIQTVNTSVFMNYDLSEENIIQVLELLIKERNKARKIV